MIAVAIDGSEASAPALAFAIDLAQREGKQLSGVFVLDTGWADFIGNDWQSSRNARQGFLDYVLEELQKQAELARDQFAVATSALPGACFISLPGVPAEALCEMMGRDEFSALVLGPETFQCCGRPSAKRLVKDLRKKVRQPLYVV